ncbi:MAG UNVERIFIED_CONTAM: hypothetical protein LVR18_07200 [Planctomycetaceae bacterium]|jgi:hypothetical protein
MSDSMNDKQSKNSSTSVRTVEPKMFEQSYSDGFFISRVVGLERLKRLCQQTAEWGGRWLFSREFEQLPAALPVVLTLLLFAGLAAWGLDRGDVQSVRLLYLSALSEATTAGNVAGQEVCLRQLCSLAPRESGFPLQLAELFVTQGALKNRSQSPPSWRRLMRMGLLM